MAKTPYILCDGQKHGGSVMLDCRTKNIDVSNGVDFGQLDRMNPFVYCSNLLAWILAASSGFKTTKQ